MNISFHRFEMLRLRDVPEETRNLIKGKQPNVAAVSIQSLEENEILGESSSQSGTIERLSHNRITMSCKFIRRRENSQSYVFSKIVWC